MPRASARLALAWFVLFVPAAAVADEITLTISGVAATDMPAVREELGRIEGVSKVAVRKLKDRQSTVTVEFTGKGGDLAVKLAAAASGLKNVKEFDDMGVTIEFGGSTEPTASGGKAPDAGAAGGKPDAPSAATPAGVARRIPGGTPQTYQGVPFDLPKNWKAQATDQGTVLLPGGANPGGIVEEFYCIVHDPVLKSIDGDDFLQSVEKFVGAIQPGAERAGPPRKEKYGARDGRLFLFKARTPDGKAAEVRVHGFMGGTRPCALVALGFPDKLAARQADVQAILGSLGEPVETAGAGGGEGVRPELVGQWSWVSSFSANAGGGLSSSRTLTLQADGTYTYTGESSASGNVSGGTFGTASQQGDSGTWTATENSLTFHSRDGETKTYALEKRNHPKNPQDPMIVLDGQPFVTATQREPW